MACNQKELDNQKATIDSLQAVVEAKDTEINDLFDMLNDIEENMSAISSKYSSVQELRRNNTEGSYNHKNEIASQMKSIESMMAECRLHSHQRNYRLQRHPTAVCLRQATL